MKKNTNCIFKILPLLAALAFPSLARAEGKLKVVTTLPDLAWAAREIGKDRVEAKSLLKGSENPHFADAVPDFIRLVADADVVCLAGLELEVGWLPKVLSRSGNSKVQPSGAGYCEMGKAIEPLDKPAGAVDRSMGDVHPFGNPHFWLSPKALAKSTDALVEALIRVDAPHAKEYRENQTALREKLEKAVERGKAKLAPLVSKIEGPALVEYHKEFAYLLEAYGLRSFGSIEEKPGVPPSAGRLAEVAQAAKAAGVRFALAAPYSPRKTTARFKELSGIPILELPTSTAAGSSQGYVEHQEALVEQVAKALRP
jgi:zinc/manganese transport system substrate-binding protein